MSSLILRSEANKFETSYTCVLCMRKLEIAHQSNLNKGVCIECGFPYDIDSKNQKVESELDDLILSSRDITTRHINCMREHYDKTSKPAPLWSYSPFYSAYFEEFSIWAHDNNYGDMAWLEENEI